MTEPEWRAMIEARLANLERQTGVERDRPAEQAAAEEAARADRRPILPLPLPFRRQPRVTEGGPACPATMADDAELDRRLQAFLDIPGTEP